MDSNVAGDHLLSIRRTEALEKEWCAEAAKRVLAKERYETAKRERIKAEEQLLLMQRQGLPQVFTIAAATATDGSLRVRVELIGRL